MEMGTKDAMQLFYIPLAVNIMAGVLWLRYELGARIG